MKKETLFLCLILSSLSAICQHKTPANLRLAYFPIDSILTGKTVYCYKTYQNFRFIGNLYQILWIEIQGTDTFVNQEIANNSLESTEIWRMRITAKGIELIDHREFTGDTINPVIVSTIIQPDIIHWDYSHNKKYVVRLKNDYRDMKRLRTSVRLADSVEFESKSYLCFLVTDNIIVKEHEGDFKQTRKLSRKSYYVSGIGMVKSVQKYPDVFITFTLDKIMHYEVWKNHGKQEF